MEKLRKLVKNAYFSTFDTKRREQKVWDDLKAMLTDQGLRFGIYEQERCIQLNFSLSKDHGSRFIYYFHNGQLYTAATILEHYPVQMSTDVFVLASHLNNVLPDGQVTVNVRDSSVDFMIKRCIWNHLFDPREMSLQIWGHARVAEDVLWAYDRLLQENEAPAIIIADLLRKVEAKASE